MSSKRRIILAATLIVAGLSGCTAGPWATLQQSKASNLNALDLADLPLDKLPDEILVVPATRSRAPQQITFQNSAVLHVSPSETFPAFLAFLSNAKRSIYLETFSFGNDAMGDKIVPILLEKAKEGLEVKLNMDYMGSRFLAGHKDIVAKLRAGGVDVRVYRPRTVRKENRVLGLNITHRKVYLVDGETALIGGVNLHHPFELTTQDVLIQWKGPVVAQLYNEYATDWHLGGGGTLRQTASVSPQGGVSAQVLVTSPGEGRFEARDAINAAVDGAKSEILVEQQYFWDDLLIGKLHAAIKRGVKLRVMVPSFEGNSIFKNIHTEELKKLVDEGAEARIYRGNPSDAHLHVKYISVDDRWATVGSVNGDTRGMTDNQELDTATTDPQLIGQLRQRLFERDWANFSLPFVYQPATGVMRPFRSLLEALDYYL